MSLQQTHTQSPNQIVLFRSWKNVFFPAATHFHQLSVDRSKGRQQLTRTCQPTADQSHNAHLSVCVYTSVCVYLKCFGPRFVSVGICPVRFLLLWCWKTMKGLTGFLVPCLFPKLLILQKSRWKWSEKALTQMLSSFEGKQLIRLSVSTLKNIWEYIRMYKKSWTFIISKMQRARNWALQYYYHCHPR